MLITQIGLAERIQQEIIYRYNIADKWNEISDALWLQINKSSKFVYCTLKVS